MTRCVRTFFSYYGAARMHILICSHVLDTGALSVARRIFILHGEIDIGFPVLVCQLIQTENIICFKPHERFQTYAIRLKSEQFVDANFVAVKTLPNHSFFLSLAMKLSNTLNMFK